MKVHRTGCHRHMCWKEKYCLVIEKEKNSHADCLHKKSIRIRGYHHSLLLCLITYQWGNVKSLHWYLCWRHGPSSPSILENSCYTLDGGNLLHRVVCSDLHRSVRLSIAMWHILEVVMVIKFLLSSMAMTFQEQMTLNTQRHGKCFEVGGAWGLVSVKLGSVKLGEVEGAIKSGVCAYACVALYSQS